MKKINSILSILFILIPFCITVKAQDYPCRQWPAQCPSATPDFYTKEVRLGNKLTELEVEMQDNAKNITDAMMQHASEKLHWPMVILGETVNNTLMQDGTTPPDLRSPRPFGIVYQFVVNNDSLSAWRQWLTDFSNRYQNAGNSFFEHKNNSQNSPEYKRYMDSAHHYNKLIAYFLASKKTNLTEAENKKMDDYGAKQNQFTDKANALISNDHLEDYDAERTNKTNDFKNATIVQVYFNFNSQTAGMDNDHSQNKIKNVELKGAGISRFIHFAPRNETGGIWVFNSWDTMMAILLGNWVNDPHNSKKDFVAAFTQKKGQNNESTPKIIKSYKVQTISIHILGNTNNIMKMAGQLDMAKLNGALAY